MHPIDDQLESYCLHTLPPDQVDAIEDHLLICAACRDQLDEITVYVRAMRKALQMRQGKPRSPFRRLVWRIVKSLLRFA